MPIQCNVNNVPPQVLDNQLTELDRLQRECEAAGGKMITRAILGCDNQQIKDYKGGSNWEPYDPNKGPYNDQPGLDGLPNADGSDKTLEEIDELVAERRRQAFRDALEGAKKAAGTKNDCGDANPAFAMQSA
jgi:hypothetical protein